MKETTRTWEITSYFVSPCILISQPECAASSLQKFIKSDGKRQKYLHVEGSGYIIHMRKKKINLAVVKNFPVTLVPF